MVSSKYLPKFTLGKDPVPNVQEAGGAPEPVWTGAENLARPGFDSQTVQPVASRYTDYASLSTPSTLNGCKNLLLKVLDQFYILIHVTVQTKILKFFTRNSNSNINKSLILQSTEVAIILSRFDTTKTGFLLRSLFRDSIFSAS